MTAPKFVFTPTPEFKAEVKVSYPHDGTFTEMAFTGHFVLDPEVDLSQPLEATTSAERRIEEIERLKEIFVGWDGIETEHGDMLEVSDEAMDALLGQVPIRTAIVGTYIEQNYGGALRLGNSAPRPEQSGVAGKPKKKRRGQR